ncbi:MAG: MBL fold metallo-hydrolase [Candidatus Krumholzibacteriia bacterium]
MKLFLAGVRGSRPVTGSQVARYGGDTTSVLVTGRAGETVVIDAGSGLAAIEPRLGGPAQDVLLLLTHLHLDHLQGLPGFGPFWQAGRRIVVLGPLGSRDAACGLVGPPYWPLSLVDAPADVAFTEGDPAAVVWGGLRISSFPVAHPGGSLAYRIDEPATNRSLVFATDVEWESMDASARRDFAAFCRTPAPVDLLLMDGHLTPANAPDRRGWGHSSYEEVAAAGEAAGAGRVLVIHHDPDHDDGQLDRLAADLEAHVAQRGYAFTAALARQGDEEDLGG